MAEKYYYGYVRPKLPNYPWSLEKIPLGRSIISSSSDKPEEVKSRGLIPFNIKLVDDLGLTLNNDGSFTILPGRYMIQIYLVANTKDAGLISISLNGKGEVYGYSQGSATPVSMSGMALINVTESGKSFEISNISDKSIKVSNLMLVITKV